MTAKTSMFLKIQNPKASQGQIAVFLLLAFQFLFILFAATLNVALIVHDKINLQNSADLAAFYGAKKQAEVLNAIAHINYQMRQNYKLLAWRYRILGSLAQPEGLGRTDEAWCPKPKQNTSPGSYYLYNCTDPYHGGSSCPTGPYHGYCDSNFTLCFSADLWVRGIHDNLGSQNNLCTNQRTSIPEPEPVEDLAGFFIPLVSQAIDMQAALSQKVDRTCKGESVINWLMGQIFLSQFRLDQKDRKMMIHALYNATLKKDQDLDGNSIKEGVKRTFEKNLTWVNRQNMASADFEIFNSLKDEDIENFLKAIYIYPVLEYLHFYSGGGVLCSDVGEHKYSYYIPVSFPSDDVTNKYINYITQWMSLFKQNQYTGSPSQEQFISPLTLGYEKNRDFRVYYGVSVALPHSSVHQLFSPFPSTDSLKLKASAFAKPFGGRIGPPWDKDPLLQNQIAAVRTAGSGTPLHPWVLKPNYSRFPGDDWGLIHKEAHGQYYFLKQEEWLDRGPNPFSINNYSNLTDHDPLASSGGNPFFVLRMMELMAVAPDIYDVMNYSFFNNYMTTYFPKICQRIGEGGNCGKINPSNLVNAPALEGFIRGDFGHPHSSDYAGKNKLRRKHHSSLVPFFFTQNSLELQETSHPGIRGHHAATVLPPYLIKDPAHFLTGFMPTTQKTRYAVNAYKTPDPKTFMKCYKTTKENLHVPSGCAVGGRSGYSVKLVSCDVIHSLPSDTSKPPGFPDGYCQ